MMRIPRPSAGFFVFARHAGQLSARLDVQFVAILRTGSGLRVYCSDEADIRELFDGVIPIIEEVPEGGTLN